jgi:transposase InsO family protein
LANSASVFSPLIAASATFALKPGLCVRRARFVILAPEPRHLRSCQAETLLIGLSEFPEPPLKTLARCKATGATLLVAKLDRLSRNLPFLRGLIDGGADVAFCDMPQVPAGAISRPTLRKWLRRYDAEGEAGLREMNRRPRHSPARKVGHVEEAQILALRRDRRLGVKRLRIELRRLHGVRLSPSVIHKVLVRHDLSSLPRRARPRHKPKLYSRPVPGDRVQIDNCKIRPGLWQFTAVDDCSRYLVAGLARRPSAAAALAFLEQVLDEVPFAIQRVQTDRGAEFFAAEVQRRLMAGAIKFRPIPPRSPHLNGKVERAQRTVLEEFWATVDAQAPDIGDQLALWVHHYNWDRPHEALGRPVPDRPGLRARRQDPDLGRGRRRLRRGAGAHPGPRVRR